LHEHNSQRKPKKNSGMANFFRQKDRIS